jgi:cytochrome P450
MALYQSKNSWPKLRISSSCPLFHTFVLQSSCKHLPPPPSIIFASIHGTAVALSWVLYKVACDPTYQQTLYTEIAEHITDGDDATALTPTKLKTMSHLDSFTREVLRGRPDCLSPTPRMAMKDIELDNGYIIPKGRRLYLYSPPFNEK